MKYSIPQDIQWPWAQARKQIEDTITPSTVVLIVAVVTNKTPIFVTVTQGAPIEPKSRVIEGVSSDWWMPIRRLQSVSNKNGVVFMTVGLNGAGEPMWWTEPLMKGFNQG